MSNAAIRRILGEDRIWSAYALGDLSPELASYCEWFVTPGPPTALLMLFRAFERPILFAHGDADALASIVGHVDEPTVEIQARPEALSAISTRYLIPAPRAMWRMALDAGCPRPVDREMNVATLGPSDLGALKTLYSDGAASDEAPDCFHDSMIERGIYKGVWQRGVLVAAAGTHVLSSAEGVCAIGNVYTRRDHRRRGLGAQVTHAVAAEARARGVATVVLNVLQESPAVRVYERLGFRRHCALIEGTARLSER